VWVCRESLVGPIFFSMRDETGERGSVECVRLSDVADAVDIVSQVSKSLRWLEAHGPWPF